MKPFSSSGDLFKNANQQNYTFNLTKDTQESLAQTGSQIQLNIVPPQEDKIAIKNGNDEQARPNKKRASRQENGVYQNNIEINNNYQKEEPIETLDCANNLVQPLTSQVTTSESGKSKYSFYWSRLSKKRTNLNKPPSQSTNSSEKRRFKQETKAAKTVGIIVGCFWCCWFPFFTVYLIRGLCEDKVCFKRKRNFIFLFSLNNGSY